MTYHIYVTRCLCMRACVCVCVCHTVPKHTTTHRTTHRTTHLRRHCLPFHLHAWRERERERERVCVCVCKRVQSLSVDKCEKTSILHFACILEGWVGCDPTSPHPQKEQNLPHMHVLPCALTRGFECERTSVRVCVHVCVHVNLIGRLRLVGSLKL